MLSFLGNQDGALEKRLTHMPFTHAFTGSNPVRVTIQQTTSQQRRFFLYPETLVPAIGSLPDVTSCLSSTVSRCMIRRQRNARTQKKDLRSQMRPLVRKTKDEMKEPLPDHCTIPESTGTCLPVLTQIRTFLCNTRRFHDIQRLSLYPTRPGRHSGTAGPHPAVPAAGRRCSCFSGDSA